MFDRTEYMRIYHIKNREKRNAYSKQYKIINGEKLRAKRRKRYKEIGDEKIYNTNFRATHRELYRAYTKKSVAKNPEKQRQKLREYYAKNPLIIHAENIAKQLPMGKECMICPPNDIRTDRLHRHHPDYNYPTIFVTVCPSCHKYIHMDMEN